MKALAFTHDVPPQRVVFASGALARVGDEVVRLNVSRALVVATPGSGARLGQKVVELLGPRAAGLHAQAVIHVPKAVAEAGLAAARESKADGVVAVGGGSAIGLAKAIALQTALPIIAVPTTYSGSETTTIYGVTEAARKVTGRDQKVLPRTIIYDPDLTLDLPPAVSAASGMNAIAHCVESFWARRPHAGDAGAGERSRCGALPKTCRRWSPMVLTKPRARNASSPPGLPALC